MKASLLFEGDVLGDFYSTRYSLDSSEITLGRAPDRDIQIPAVFFDVSRNHCSFYRENGSLLVKDESSEGTYVNGQVFPGVFVHLYDGDELKFGDHLKAKVVIRKSLAAGMKRSLISKLKSLFD